MSSSAEFEERIDGALARRAPDGLLWISNPKVAGKNRYDINRDSLWDRAIPHGIHPVSQVSLDETWSAVRFADNKPGEDYQQPNNNLR